MIQIKNHKFVFFFCFIIQLILGASNIASADKGKVQKYAIEMQEALVETAENKGTGQFARVIRKYIDQADSITLSDINDFFLDVNEGNPLVQQLKNRKIEIKEMNERAKRAGLTGLIYEQDPQAELIENFRSFKQHSGDQTQALSDLATLSQKIYGNLQPHEIRIPVLSDEIESAKKPLSEANRIRSSSFFFSLDPAVNTVEKVPLERFDKPRPDQAKVYEWMTRGRVHASWMTAVGGGIIGGFMSGTPLPGTVAGIFSGGTEYQFGKFSAFWNDHVWSKYGFTAIATANLVIPVIISGTSWITLYLQGNGGHVFSPLMFKRFAVQVTFSMLTTMATLGAVQIALAREKTIGQIGESLRFKLENVFALNNILMRMLQLALPAATAATAAALAAHGTDWGMWEPINFHHFGLAQWIALGTQSVVLVGLSVPMWLKLKLGDKYYDYRTAEIANEKAGIIPEKRNLFSSIGGFCRGGLGALANLYTWSK